MHHSLTLNQGPSRSSVFSFKRRSKEGRYVIVAAHSSSQAERTKKLRDLLECPGILLGPAAYDGISARLTEQAGFDFAFMSGFCVAGSRLGFPDTGLISYAEMVDQGRNMHEATRSIPIIGDGDTGYGNAMNVKRTVQGYASAGFAGILIEDQIWPKSCGHVKGKRVVPRDEAVARIRAACDARDQGQDLVIVARTDARQAASFEEAMYRAAAFADTGADVVFVDALESVEEMKRLCKEVKGAHKMANMLEGGGKTPILSPEELESMGFKLCAYPLSLLGVSIAAMQDALTSLKSGTIPRTVPSFPALQSVVGFPDYFIEEAKYTVPSSGSSSSNTPPPPPPVVDAPVTVTADAVVEPGAPPYTAGRVSQSSSAGAGGMKTVDMVVSSRDDEYRQREDRRVQWLKVKITDERTNTVKLETRFPAGFLNSVASFVPQVAGVDFEQLMKQTKGEGWDPKQPLVDFQTDGDKVEIFLEFE